MTLHAGSFTCQAPMANLCACWTSQDGLCRQHTGLRDVLFSQTKVLEGSQYAWLGEMLNAFNHGDLHAYDTLCSTYASELNAQPALVANERKLREKITIACLMELIFT